MFSKYRYILQSSYLELLAGVLVFVFLVGVYTFTRTEVHTFDALSYTQDVENKPFIQLYHPHHLLYGPVGRMAADVAKAFGYHGRADVPIQFMNAVAGALGVVALWRFGARFSGHTWPALGVALLMGTAYAYWVYAAEVEVYTLAALFICLSLWLLARLHDDPRPSGALALGAAVAGAVMFHQTNAMFAAPVSLFMLADPRLRRYWPRFLATLAVLVIIPYALVGLQGNFANAEAYYNWLTDYAQQGQETGNWGGFLGLAHLSALREGLLDTVSPHAPALAILFYALTLVGAALGTPVLLREQGRPWLAFAGVWLVLYGGFFWWWEPWNIEFWIALLPLWGLFWFAALRGGLADGIARWHRARPTVIGGTAVILAALLFNAHYRPIQAAADADNDYYQLVTRALQPHLANTDLVVTRGNILDLYLPFYAHHPSVLVISMRELHFGGQPANALIDTLRRAHQRGQIVYIDQFILAEPQNSQRNPFGLTAADIGYIEATFPLVDSVHYNGHTAFYSLGARSAPDQHAWDFETHLHGWLAFGAQATRFEDGGWCLTGGGDPWLNSPALALSAAEYPRVVIDMALRAPAEGAYGQLFWRNAAQDDLSEERSRRFDLREGRHTYTLDLRNAPGWRGEIIFLRLDPIPGNLDVTACVYDIRIEATRPTG
ncbi:MAG: glycosyltransferase family 39 protein [Anaerolineales bacterium]